MKTSDTPEYQKLAPTIHVRLYTDTLDAIQKMEKTYRCSRAMLLARLVDNCLEAGGNPWAINPVNSVADATPHPTTPPPSNHASATTKPRGVRIPPKLRFKIARGYQNMIFTQSTIWRDGGLNPMVLHDGNLKPEVVNMNAILEPCNHYEYLPVKFIRRPDGGMYTTPFVNFTEWVDMYQRDCTGDVEWLDFKKHIQPHFARAWETEPDLVGDELYRLAEEHLHIIDEEAINRDKTWRDWFEVGELHGFGPVDGTKPWKGVLV